MAGRRSGSEHGGAYVGGQPVLPPEPITYVVAGALEPKPVANPDDLAIERLGQLERNWGSYDAEPVAESVIARALAIVQTAREAALKLGQSWLGPETDPTPRGHVSLTWRRDDQRLSLDIRQLRIFRGWRRESRP